MSIAIVPPSCSMCYPSSSIFVYLSRFQLLTGQDKPHNNTMEKDSTSHSLPHGNTCLTTLMEYNGPWSHQQFNFQEDATAEACDDDDLLVNNQPKQQAGFHSNGKFHLSLEILQWRLSLRDQQILASRSPILSPRKSMVLGSLD